MKLNKEIRGQIVRRCLAEQFEKATKDLAAEERSIGSELYRASFDAKLLKTVESVPENWLRMDGCLRFNVKGFALQFYLQKPVPVPYSYGCQTIGTFADGELANRALKQQESTRELTRKRGMAEAQLRALLGSVQTTESLAKVWPEGKRFYEQFDAATPKSGLPAVMISNLNGLLGLTPISQQSA